MGDDEAMEDQEEGGRRQAVSSVEARAAEFPDRTHSRNGVFPVQIHDDSAAGKLGSGNGVEQFSACGRKGIKERKLIDSTAAKNRILHRDSI